MYSFEGNFRSLPQVSLGGRSKEEKYNKASLLHKAQVERLKRENARKELRSTILLQSTVRSFLVRKKVKQEFRELFDQMRGSNFDHNKLGYVIRQLCFFFDRKTDPERLVWLCQNILKSSNVDWQKVCSSHLMSQVMVLCCRYLLSNTSTSAAIPLRMLETQMKKFLATESDENLKLKHSSYIWRRIIRDGNFFLCLLEVFKKKVPLDIEAPSGVNNRNPQLALAASLLDIMKQPLIFAKHLIESQQKSHFDKFTDNEKIQQSQTIDFILGHFCSDFLCNTMTHQIYSYILPMLSRSLDFPVNPLLSFVERNINMKNNLRKNIHFLSSLILLVKPSFDSISNKSAFLAIIQWLVPTIPRCGNVGSSMHDIDDSSDEDEDEEMEVAGCEWDIPQSQLANDCLEFLTSSDFIKYFVKQEVAESQVITTFCEISFHLIAKMRIPVHTNRFLYTLAFSPNFLKHLWTSIIHSRSKTRNSMMSLSSIRALLDGCHMTEASMHDLVIRLVTFSSMLSHNLLSLHDVDFYAGPSSSHGLFPMDEIIRITTTLRDVCLCCVKIILPETRTHLLDYDVREVYHCLSTGKLLRFAAPPVLGNRPLDVTTAALCFKVCSRLLNQLHTRHTRRAFAKDDIWLSSAITIGDDRSKYLSSNWRRRKLRNENIAAHMADPSDEDLPITITEARQLSVLTNLPFVVPFQTRVQIFTTMLSQDRQSRESNRDVLLHDAGFNDTSTVIRVTVRRDFLYEDAFNDLSEHNAPDLRRVLRVAFVNQAGASEAGYGEGVTREFLQQIVRTAFDPKRGLFQLVGESGLYPNPYASRLFENYQQHFRFLGRLLGKILYEGMQVELPFAAFFLSKLLRHKNSDVDINHLQSLDPDFYRNLMFLRSYEGDVANLDLDFTVVDDRFGETSVTELIPNGRNISVTNDNRVRYIHLLANYKLNVQMRAACDAFREGLSAVVPIEWLRMFDHREFQTLLSGAEASIDVMDMKNNAVFSGGYTSDHGVVQLFWEVLSEFTEADKRKLLLFVTSCSRPPLLGFKEMHPPFCIHNGGEADRLPTSSTCLNLLRLPQYDTAEQMKEKLLYCLNSESGFELS
uniref:HECT-type E3 ubiquitin transferase n=1 Tax=Phallusia mammillata TaxID=59560 RepID=A0A6F9DWT0_9ASCI|nr:ubiquitin-protein ligase E3C-like [Phallusia mammillata]